MKSAYERAMERTGGGTLRELPPEQKSQLAEISSVYEAKIAHAKLLADDDLRKAGADKEKTAKIRQDLATELTALAEERDRKKDALRREFGR